MQWIFVTYGRDRAALRYRTTGVADGTPMKEQDVRVVWLARSYSYFPPANPPAILIKNCTNSEPPTSTTLPTVARSFRFRIPGPGVERKRDLGRAGQRRGHGRFHLALHAAQQCDRRQNGQKDSGIGK